MLPHTYTKLVVVKASADLHEACEVQEIPLEKPAADEILVKTHYAGVNAADYLMARGRYLMPTPPPYDMGGESVAIVVAIGANVESFKVGDKARAVRGGCWDFDRGSARGADRSWNLLPSLRHDRLGFRLVCASPIF